jgi:signal transduction histidine kinase
VLAEQAVAARAAIDTLSSLSRGIYPNLLARDGLVPALRGALATSATNINIEGEGVGRLPAPVEAALYFCCMEAVQNAAKHAEAETVTVRVSEEAGGWRLTVIDDGAGFAEAQDWASSSGAGLANMRDRLDAIGGTVTLESFSGRGTTVTATVANRDDLEVEQRHIPSPRQVR